MSEFSSNRTDASQDIGNANVDQAEVAASLWQQRMRRITERKQATHAYQAKLRRIEAKRLKDNPESIEAPANEVSKPSPSVARFIGRVTTGDAYVYFGDIGRTEDKRFSNLGILVISPPLQRGVMASTHRSYPQDLTLQGREQITAILHEDIEARDTHPIVQAYATAFKHGYIDMPELNPSPAQ